MGSFIQKTQKILQGLIGLGLVTAAFMIVAPSYRHVGNFTDIFAQSAVLAIMATGTTVVLISGALDLSVGSILALSACVAGLLLTNGLPVWLAIAGALGAGMAVGVGNGLTVVITRVPSFIVTLGSLMIARGIAEMIGAGHDMSYFPEAFRRLGEGWVTPAVIAGSVTVVVLVLMATTKAGFYCYAVGGNEEVARLSGVPVGRLRVVYYGLGGLLAGLAGVVEAARLNYVEPNYGLGWELQAIAAAVIGGTSLFGGTGGVGRTLIGVLIIRSLYAGLIQCGVSSYWQQVVIGLVIIVAVWIDIWQRRKKT